MQDNAPPHTEGETIHLLHQLFGNRVISLGTAHEWVPHTSDFNPLDFIILWCCQRSSLRQQTSNPGCPEAGGGWLPSGYHSNYLQTGCTENFVVRIKACLNRGGAHIENVNYKQYNEWFENGMVCAFHQCITELATFCNVSPIKHSNSPLFGNTINNVIVLETYTKTSTIRRNEDDIFI